MKRQVSNATAAMRAELWFELFYAIGPERSLHSLSKYGAAMGLDMPSMTTLKRWSNAKEWKKLVVERDARWKGAREEQALSEIETMNQRQAIVASAMQQLGARIVNTKLSNEALLAEATVGEAARIIDVGAKLERLARGAVTDRQEIIVSVWTTVVEEVAVLFLQINSMEDPAARAREFAHAVDDLIDKHAAQQMAAAR